MRRMQHLSHHLRKQIPHLTYGRAVTKGGKPIVTRNRRIKVIRYKIRDLRGQNRKSLTSNI